MLSPDRIPHVEPLSRDAADYEIVRRAIAFVSERWRAQPEIEAIASIAVEKPSVFKLAKLATGTQFMTFFGGPNTQAVDPAKLGLVPVALEAFDAPFSFGFGADAIVTGVMVVTPANLDSPEAKELVNPPVARYLPGR